MLDFVSLQKLLDDMVHDQTIIHRNYREKFALAHQTLVDWAAQWKVLPKNRKSRTFRAACQDLCEPDGKGSYPLPSPERSLPLPQRRSRDFFRIASETFYRYRFFDWLSGRLSWHYGTGERLLLTNHPRLFAAEDEIYRE